MDNFSPAISLSQPNSASRISKPNVSNTPVKDVLAKFKYDLETCITAINQLNEVPKWKEIKKLQLYLTGLKGIPVPLNLFKLYLNSILKYIEIVMNFIPAYYSDFPKQMQHIGALFSSVSALFVEKTHCSIFLQRAATRIFDMVLIIDNPLIIKTQLLHMLNDIIINSDIRLWKNIGNQQIDYLYRLFDWLPTLGDYLAQITVMKLILNIFAENITGLKYSLLPGNEQLEKELININRSNINSDARQWLNKFNEKSNLIFSFAYKGIRVGSMNCDCPTEGDLKYIDFNIQERMASFYTKISEDNWNRVFILGNYVDKVEIQSTKSLILLSIKLTNACVSQKPSQQRLWNELDLHMQILLINTGNIDKLKLVLRKIFGDQISPSPEPAAHSESFAEKPINEDIIPEKLYLSSESCSNTSLSLERRSCLVADSSSNTTLDEEDNSIILAPASVLMRSISNEIAAGRTKSPKRNPTPQRKGGQTDNRSIANEIADSRTKSPKRNPTPQRTGGQTDNLSILSEIAEGSSKIAKKIATPKRKGAQTDNRSMANEIADSRTKSPKRNPTSQRKGGQTDNQSISNVIAEGRTKSPKKIATQKKVAETDNRSISHEIAVGRTKSPKRSATLQRKGTRMDNLSISNEIPDGTVNASETIFPHTSTEERTKSRNKNATPKRAGGSNNVPDETVDSASDHESVVPTTVCESPNESLSDENETVSSDIQSVVSLVSEVREYSPPVQKIKIIAGNYPDSQDSITPLCDIVVRGFVPADYSTPIRRSRHLENSIDLLDDTLKESEAFEKETELWQPQDNCSRIKYTGEAIQLQEDISETEIRPLKLTKEENVLDGGDDSQNYPCIPGNEEPELDKFVPTRKRVRPLPSDESDLDSPTLQKVPLLPPLNWNDTCVTKDEKATAVQSITVNESEEASNIAKNRKPEDSDPEPGDRIHLEIPAPTHSRQFCSNESDDPNPMPKENLVLPPLSAIDENQNPKDSKHLDQEKTASADTKEIDVEKNYSASGSPPLRRKNRRLYDSTDHSYLDKMMEAKENQVPDLGIEPKSNKSRQTHSLERKGFEIDRSVIDFGKTFLGEPNPPPVSLVEDTKFTKRNQHAILDISARSPATKKKKLIKRRRAGPHKMEPGKKGRKAPTRKRVRPLLPTDKSDLDSPTVQKVPLLPPLNGNDTCVTEDEKVEAVHSITVKESEETSNIAKNEEPVDSDPEPGDHIHLEMPAPTHSRQFCSNESDDPNLMPKENLLLPPLSAIDENQNPKASLPPLSHVAEYEKVTLEIPNEEDEVQCITVDTSQKPDNSKPGDHIDREITNTTCSKQFPRNDSDDNIPMIKNNPLLPSLSDVNANQNPEDCTHIDMDEAANTVITESDSKKNCSTFDNPPSRKTNRRLYDPRDYSYLDELMKAQENQVPDLDLDPKPNKRRPTDKRKGFEMDRIDFGNPFLEELNTPVRLGDNAKFSKKKQRVVLDISSRSSAKKKNATKRRQRRKGFDIDRSIIGSGITFFTDLGDFSLLDEVLREDQQFPKAEKSLRSATKKTPNNKRQTPHKKPQTSNKKRQSKKQSNTGIVPGNESEPNALDLLFPNRSEVKKTPTVMRQKEVAEIDIGSFSPDLCDQMINPVDIAVESQTNQTSTLPVAPQETAVKPKRINILQNDVLVPAKRPAMDHVDNQLIKKIKVGDAEKDSQSFTIQREEWQQLLDIKESFKIAYDDLGALLGKIESRSSSC